MHLSPWKITNLDSTTTLTCRLINPSKSEIGVVSKHILDEINSAIIRSTQINQWKNTSSVLSWFNSLENKETPHSYVSTYVNSILQSMRSCSQRLSTLPASTDPSVDMSATSSYTQNARCCSAMIPHGRKNLQMIFSMSPWVLSTVLKRVN